MKNNPVFDRVVDEFITLRFLLYDKDWLDNKSYDIILLFIYLFSENLLEKFLMNQYEKSLYQTNLDPKKVLKQDTLLDELRPKIHNIDKINLEYYTCSDNEINKIIQNLSEEKKCSFQKIYDAFLLDIERLDYKRIIAILYFFKSIEHNHTDIFTENFLANVFEECKNYNYIFSGHKGHQHSQPLTLTLFIESYIGSIDNLQVYNPFAGYASFINKIDNSNTIYAQELTTKAWAVGQLSLLLNKSLATFNCEDSIYKWPKNKKFDLIISYPPFNMVYRNKFLNNNRNINIESFIINKSIDSLSKKGKAILILPLNTLYKGGENQRVRQRLVNEDLIDTIIHFPSGILHYTNIPFIVLKLNKLKKERNNVIFVDSEPYCTNHQIKKGITTFYPEEILHAINVRDHKTVRKISNKEIIKNNYNLNFDRYFYDEVDEKIKLEGIKLKEIITLYRENVVSEKDKIVEKQIRQKNLKNDFLDFRLNTDKIEAEFFKTSSVKIINTSCLLLSLKSTNLNPTYFNFIDKPIYLNKNITPFIINEDKDKVNINYLINELHSSYVKQQIKRFRQGTTIPFIRLNDFLNVKIKLPSIEEQNAKVAGIQELSNEIKVRQKKIEDLQAGVDSETYGNVSSVFHSLGTPIMNIISGIDNIQNALSNNVSEWKKIKISKNSNTTLNDSFSTIESELEFISTTIKKNKTKWNVKNYKLDEENLIALIKDYIKTNNSLHKKNILTTLEINEDIKSELNNKVLIYTNKQLLKTALDAIVENAHRHGFIDSKKNYKLKFNISLVSEKIENNKGIEEKVPYVKIEVSNNGKPFPDKFTVEDLIRRNFTSSNTGNTGQGGFILNEIIKYFNKGISSLDLITDNPNSEYKTTYLFLIPLNL